jgi:hypothetical protein
MTFAAVLRRVWIPLVVLAVVAGAGFAVAKVRSASGSVKFSPYASSNVDNIAQLPRKTVLYQVFGSPGTTADISYLGVNSDLRLVKAAVLPWSLQITTYSAAVVANLVAQGDSNNLGCRIEVDGHVKAERISNEVKAFTFCRVNGA